MSALPRAAGRWLVVAALAVTSAGCGDEVSTKPTTPALGPDGNAATVGPSGAAALGKGKTSVGRTPKQ